MEFLALEKIIKMTPTEWAKLEFTLTIGLKKNPEKFRKTQIPVKSYDPPNSLHHSPLLEKNEAPASSGSETVSI